jgi:hypothetical protein
MTLLNRITSAAAAGLSLMAASGVAHGAVAYALTDDNSLLGFDTASPSSTFSAVILRTAANAEIQNIIGIDFRPADGKLYGVGKLGGIYTIDPTTGISTQVGSLQADPTDSTYTFLGLNGSRFGFDFNPAVDRLRITSDADQNLRVNLTAGSVGFTTTDTTITNGSANANIVAAAYGNNVAGATTTTLYAIDTVTDKLYSSAAPNGGVYTAIGSLGFDATALSGFDIYTQNGVDHAYAALLPSSTSGSKLYSIDLATGAATEIGTIGGGDFADGLAVIPEPTTLAAVAGLTLLTLRRRKA